jgi:drug/metabolite transporter (DMT)-like permease
MSMNVFLMVLCAALVHAIWNVLVKTDANRLALIEVMSSTQFVMSLCLIPFIELPAAGSWPYLLTSSVLNTGYMLSLNLAYQSGDLSLVYPLARGIAPLIVATISMEYLGEQLSFAGRVAVLLIALAITSLALTRGAPGVRDQRPVLLALATGAFIGSYTIVDGLGARAAGTAHGYMIWLSLITSSSIVGCVSWLRKGKRVPINRRSRYAGIGAGIMSYLSSWLVIWALTLAPLALVSALRETGIVFAVVIGFVFLNEQLNLARLASIAATLIGITMLKLTR